MWKSVEELNATIKLWQYNCRSVQCSKCIFFIDKGERGCLRSALYGILQPNVVVGVGQGNSSYIEDANYYSELLNQSCNNNCGSCWYNDSGTCKRRKIISLIKEWRNTHA